MQIARSQKSLPCQVNPPDRRRTGRHKRPASAPPEQATPDGTSHDADALLRILIQVASDFAWRVTKRWGVLLEEKKRSRGRRSGQHGQFFSEANQPERASVRFGFRFVSTLSIPNEPDASAYRLMVHYSSNRIPDPALVPASTGRSSVSRRKMG